MQFIQTRAYERKRKCKRKLARERKRARVKRKILRAPLFVKGDLRLFE